MSVLAADDDEFVLEILSMVVERAEYPEIVTTVNAGAKLVCIATMISRRDWAWRRGR